MPQYCQARTGKSGCGADTDGCDEAEAGFVTLVLALATPQAVLVVRARELAAGGLNGARCTHLARLGLATLAGLGPFGRRWEEQMCEATARAFGHPGIIGLPTRDDDLRCVHTTPSRSSTTSNRQGRSEMIGRSIKSRVTSVRESTWLRPGPRSGVHPGRMPRRRPGWCPRPSSTGPGGGARPSRRRTTSHAAVRSGPGAGRGRGC